jgi:hypothetical protein
MSETIKWKRGDGDIKPSVGDLVRGAVGVAKAATGVDRAPENIITERWESCMACGDHDRGVCKRCGCFTPAKIRVASSVCPAERWLAVTVEGSTARACCGKSEQ